MITGFTSSVKHAVLQFLVINYCSFPVLTQLSNEDETKATPECPLNAPKRDCIRNSESTFEFRTSTGINWLGVNAITVEQATSEQNQPVFRFKVTSSGTLEPEYWCLAFQDSRGHIYEYREAFESGVIDFSPDRLPVKLFQGQDVFLTPLGIPCTFRSQLTLQFQCLDLAHLARNVFQDYGTLYVKVLLSPLENKLLVDFDTEILFGPQGSKPIKVSHQKPESGNELLIELPEPKTCRTYEIQLKCSIASDILHRWYSLPPSDSGNTADVATKKQNLQTSPKIIDLTVVINEQSDRQYTADISWTHEANLDYLVCQDLGTPAGKQSRIMETCDFKSDVSVSNMSIEGIQNWRIKAIDRFNGEESCFRIVPGLIPVKLKLSVNEESLLKFEINDFMQWSKVESIGVRIIRTEGRRGDFLDAPTSEGVIVGGIALCPNDSFSYMVRWRREDVVFEMNQNIVPQVQFLAHIPRIAHCSFDLGTKTLSWSFSGITALCREEFLIEIFSNWSRDGIRYHFTMGLFDPAIKTFSERFPRLKLKERIFVVSVVGLPWYRCKINISADLALSQQSSIKKIGAEKMEKGVGTSLSDTVLF